MVGLVSVAVRGLSLVVVSGATLRSGAWASMAVASLVEENRTQRAGSVAVVHGFSFPAACGVFPDQGPNPCLLH